MQAQYVPRDSWIEGTVTVCCVHGDKSELPTAEVYIEINEQPCLMKVGITTNLPFARYRHAHISGLVVGNCLVWRCY